MLFSWILSIFRSREGTNPIGKLNIPPESKKFLCALQLPDDPSRTVYILTVESFSERSVRDIFAVCRALNPGAIFTVLPSHLQLEFLEERRIAQDWDAGARLPVSYSKAFWHLTADSKSLYSPDAFAGFQITGLILGTSAFAHISAALQAASDSKSLFGLLEVPPSELDKKHQNLLQSIQTTSVISCPGFASSLFLRLILLDEVNKTIPGLRTTTDAAAALGEALRLFEDISRGNQVKQEVLALVRRFRLTLEYERLMGNDFAQRINISAPGVINYSDLTYQDRSDALLAKALQRQARKFDVVLATMDWARTAGVRRNWNVSVPAEFENYISPTLPGELKRSSDGNHELAGELSAVAIGAAALAGASRRFAGMKAGEALLQKSFITRGSIFPAYSRVIVNIFKLKSLSVLHLSFYGLMRDIQGMRTSRRPWLKFGGSLAATAGLVYAGNRLEKLVEAVPSAAGLARLGRGMNNLVSATAQLEKKETSQDWEEFYRSVREYHEEVWSR